MACSVARVFCHLQQAFPTVHLHAATRWALAPLHSNLHHQRQSCCVSCSLNSSSSPTSTSTSNSVPAVADAQVSVAAASAAQRRRFAEWLEELRRYQERHGTTLVPVHHPSGLGRWAAHQRHRWRRGTLPPERYAALCALGFAWEPYDAAWNASFLELAAFHSTHGHCNVPPSENPRLDAWVREQRLQIRAGVLDDGRRRRLEGLGFVWQPGEERWEQRFLELQRFQQEHGHCRVPKRWPQNQPLASWVDAIRTKWRAAAAEHEGEDASGASSDSGGGGLSYQQEARLRQLGFEFEPREGRFQWRYEQLRELVQRRGHLRGRLPSTGRWAGLAAWARRQRRLHAAGRLPRDRYRRLAAIGFVWDVEEAAREEREDALQALAAERGLLAAYCYLELGAEEALPLKRGSVEQRAVRWYQQRRQAGHAPDSAAE